MHAVDAIVIGAGVVGLAVARALALAGREVIVLEAEADIGLGTSSRNSEVIHAGLYYPPGSLMARTCIEGKHRLYAYCAERGIPHRRCGKLIVATDSSEAETLASIKARAEANGVDDLQLLSRSQALALEPALSCDMALLSPSSGIIDSHAYMLALQGDAEHAGATFVFHSPVTGGRVTPSGIEIAVGGAEPTRLHAAHVVNAAGLHAPALARRIEGVPAKMIPRAYFAKGNYMTLAGRSPFSRLIYPVPVPGGLGVHLTIDMGRQAKFGPDVEWVERIDYRVNMARAESFYRAIRRYWPAVPNNALQPGYAGIRPKIVPEGAPTQDFVVQSARDHGVRGLVNLFGIESPGLTGSLALAELVAEKVIADD